MERWVIVLLAAGIALVAAPARAGTGGQGVLSPPVFPSHNLPSNAITGFTVTCPAGYTAVSAGVTSPGAGATLLSLKPVGRGFAFRVGNPATHGPTRVT